MCCTHLSSALQRGALTYKCRKKNEEGCRSCHRWDCVSVEPIRKSFHVTAESEVVYMHFDLVKTVLMLTVAVF